MENYITSALYTFESQTFEDFEKKCKLLDEKDKNNQNVENFYTYSTYYQCKKCLEFFETKKILQKHISKVHEGKRYKCELCGQVFDQKKTLNIHVTRSHKTPEKIKTECYHCHKITVNKDSNGLCDNCDKKLSPVLILTRIKEDSIEPSTSHTVIQSNKKVNSTKPENIHVPSTSHVVIKSNKKANSLVYNYLVRNYHFDVAIEFMKLVGSLEDVRGGPVLEDMFTHYMKSMKSNAKVITDNKQYLKIVKLNEEYHDHIQNFQPKVGSQLDQVVLYLILEDLKTYNLSVKLTWSYLIRNLKEFQWMSIRHFSICKGGETEIMMKNYEELISKARVNNPKIFCDEILKNSSTGAKWKLIMIGVFLSKGLTKVRHAFDVLNRIMKDVKSQNFVKGRYSIEEDYVIKETVQKYGNSKETWEKLRVELNRSRACDIRQRYEEKLTKNIVKAPNFYWSIEEDKLLIDCLFKNSSLKNPKYISSLSKKNVRDSKADEKIDRTAEAIGDRWIQVLGPLLLQYHQGTINTPWKYSVLQYIYENKVESQTEVGRHMTEINKSFPWLNINVVKNALKNKNSDVQTILHQYAKTAMKTFKGKPTHSKRALKRCEEIIEYYDPKGELSEYKFCKIHDKCLKSHGCGSL